MRYFGRHLTKTEESQNKSGRFFKNCVAAVLRIKFSSSHPHTVIHKVDALLPDCGGSKNECDVFSACVCEYTQRVRESRQLSAASAHQNTCSLLFLCARTATTNKEDAAGNLCTVIFRCFCLQGKLIKKYNARAGAFLWKYHQ